MVVTEIKKQANSSRYSIFVDDEYAFSLIMEDILFFRIKVGQEIPEDKFRYISDTTLYIRAQETAIGYISNRVKTEKQVYEYLKRRDYSDEVAQRVVEFLKKYKYVDDEEYCKLYIAESKRLKPKGERLLAMELRQKGIADEIIRKVLGEEELDESEGAYQLLAKKIGNRQMDDTLKRRSIAFLMRRGYSYEIIRSAFRRIEEELPEEGG